VPGRLPPKTTRQLKGDSNIGDDRFYHGLERDGFGLEHPGVWSGLAPPALIVGRQNRACDIVAS
jgi:hypothetical protein